MQQPKPPTPPNSFSWTYVFSLALACGVLVLVSIYLLATVNKTVPESELTRAVSQPSASLSAPQALAVPASSNTTLNIASDFQVGGSLVGTTIDARVEFDAEGNILLTPALLRIYDYFMAGAVDSNPQIVLGKLRNYINSKLQMPARTQALDLVNKYYRYQLAKAELAATAKGDLSWQQEPENMRNVQQQLNDMRLQIFGKEASAKLFNDQALLDYSIAAAAIKQGDELQQISQLQDLAQQLPELDRNSVLKDLKMRELNYREAQLRAQDASAMQIFALREQLLGTAAAQRLAELDTKRHIWQQRLEKFNTEYRQILAAYNSGAERVAQIPEPELSQLLKAHGFSELEALRVRAQLQ